MTKKCSYCEKKFNPTHFNQKYHIECALKLRSKPRGTLTKKQKNLAVRMAGDIPRKEIASKLGVSLANLKRSLPGVSFNYHNKWKKNPQLVKKVIKCFESGGKKAVTKKYPDICYRSVVERYKRNKKLQSRWTDQQIIDMAKLSCFVPFSKQAEFFNRPCARKGSIKSAWSKVFPIRPSNLHGWNFHRAKLFVKKDCPYIILPTMFKSEKLPKGLMRKLLLWSDMAKHLREDCPEFVKRTIIELSKFQKWLFGDDPKLEIINIINAFE